MSLLRPPCAAFARRLFTAPPQLVHTSRSPLLSLIQKHRASPSQCRAFIASSGTGPTNVVYTPDNPTLPHVPKRTVRIGMLPGGRVDEGTIKRIFGSRLSATEGNNVLRILHHRRTVGSLADYGVDNLGTQYTHVTRATAMKGLEWLRDKYPVNEARFAQEWAEKEANRIQYELWLADPETESKYKDPGRAYRKQMELEEAQERRDQEVEDQKFGILHVGKSQFERNIEEKRRQRLLEVARAAEEKEAKEKEMEAKLATGEWVRTPTGTQLMKPGQTTYVDVFGREQVSRRKEEAEKYQKASETEFTSEEEMLSKTTLTQRLYPMSAFVLFTVVFFYGFSHYYLPPSPSYRLFPDLSPTWATLGAIFVANGLVFWAWRFMPLWPFMTRFFMHVPGYPRAVQSVLNVFSHIEWEHFLVNMGILLLVGPVCHDLVGRGTFVGTYVAAGAIGSLASLYWANLGRGPIAAHSLGASAAIWGIAALYLLLTEQDKIKIPFVKDLEAGFWPKMLFAACVLAEVRTAWVGKTKMDHASHFGGMLVGMIVAGWIRATREGGWLDGGEKGVQEGASVDAKTVDVGAIAKEGVKEVKEVVLGKGSK